MDRSTETVPCSLAGAEWLENGRLAVLFDALEAAGGTSRIAGGAVRNGLLGCAVSDVDLATDLRPEDVRAALRQARIKCVDTGIAHGTVTAVVHRDGETAVYEVTTLRVDVETFGRNASVEFTGDWVADAARRDFTINAIYCNRDGTVFDPLGGVADIERRRVRFVGDAGARIEEDYLRILRFFRINAEYGEGALDGAGLEACRTHIGGMGKLSAERIRQEMLKLLVAHRAVEVVRTMEEEGLLEHITGRPSDLARFERLCALELGASLTPDPLLRLAALWPGAALDIPAMRRRYVLTNAEKKRLEFVAGRRMHLTAGMAAHKAREALYRYGPAAFGDALLYDASAQKEGGVEAEIALARAWEAPRFPLSGKDALDAGISGAEVGAALRAVEEKWIASRFSIDTSDLRSALEGFASRKGE